MFKLESLFTDQMILQRGKTIYLWGNSDKSDEIEVKIDGEFIVRKKIGKGKFKLEIPPQEAKWNATLELEGENRIILNNVDIGEVWVAGGQSNMEFLLRYDEEGRNTMNQKNDEHLRFYDVGEYTFPEEKSYTKKENVCWDKWVTLNPDTAEYFSAVGYYFAEKMKEALQVPVGIIGCNWGGTSASDWIDISYLQKNKKLRVYSDEYEEETRNLNMEEYIKKHDLYLDFMTSKEAADVMNHLLAHAPGPFEVLTKIPFLIKFMRTPDPMGPRNPYAPGVLYQNMLLQIAGISCRGVIWYQGESDDYHADIYDELISSMIRCWRDLWKEELPFLMVELAPFGKWMWNTGEKYPEIREHQRKVGQTLDGVGTISILDVGMKNDIHPKKKRPVGERLALLARAMVYQQEVPYQAPEMSDVKVLSGKLSISFLNAADGLSLKGKKCNDLEIVVDGKPLKKYSCRVGKHTVGISSPKIRQGSKVEIHYAWKGYCEVNLFNSIGLSARPFRWKNY